MRRGFAGKVIQCVKGPEVGASLVNPGLFSCIPTNICRLSPVLKVGYVGTQYGHGLVWWSLQPEERVQQNTVIVNWVKMP